MEAAVMKILVVEDEKLLAATDFPIYYYAQERKSTRVWRRITVNPKYEILFIPTKSAVWR